MDYTDQTSFIEASRHVPKLLRHQLLCHLTSRYILDDSINDQNHVFIAQEQLFQTQPSMERFYGALLFVDISGFTALSLKLDVEALKNHINDYFSKMLDVIDKWSGDVIKFAGDALYIVWPVLLPMTGGGGGGGGGGGNSLHTTSSSNKSANRIHTAKNILEDPRFISAAKAAVDKAVQCAMEINFCCCNHKIILGENIHESKSRWTKLFNTLPLLNGYSSVSKNNPSNHHNPNGYDENEEIVYLNVHSGVGFGLMAGADIGANERWEFFLLGEPIQQSAQAESRAGMGEVVISNIAHNLVHDELDLEFHDCFNEELPCGCHQLEGRFFRVTSKSTSSSRSGVVQPRRAKSTRHRRKSQQKIEEFYISQELESNQAKLLEDYQEEIDSIFSLTFNLLKKQVFRFMKDYSIDPMTHLAHDLMIEEDEHHHHENDANGYPSDKKTPFSNVSHQQQVSNKDNSSVTGADTSTNEEGGGTAMDNNAPSQKSSSTKEMRKIDKYLNHFVHYQIQPAFLQWLRRCLLDDLIRHTHEAPRKKFDFVTLQRLNVLDEFLKSFFFLRGDIVQVARNLRASFQNNSNSPNVRRASFDENVINNNSGRINNNNSGRINNNSNTESPPNRRPQRRYSKGQSFVYDVGLSAELRTVTVMFIKIESLDVNLFVEDDPSESIKSFQNSYDRKLLYSKFNFIQRSPWEENADIELLNRLQQCISIICLAFAENDGQLRQFIVDDKGTVCIGTFGLRGSMAVDNAASAIECAKTIVTKLHEMDLSVSIGITTGKGYCGSVGSRFRYEYAVMGPSTNLSARLMGKAGLNQIICDTETRTRDRTHRFDALTAIKAKGYDHPVQTYMPVFDEPLYPGQNREDPGQYGIAVARRKSISVGLLRSSLDSTGLEYILSRSIKAENDWRKLNQENGSKRLTNPSNVSNINNSSGNNLLTMEGALTGGAPVYLHPGEELLKEVIRTDLIVLRRRGSRDYAIKEKGDSLINTKLYGRDHEIQEIVRFLFFPFCENTLTGIGTGSMNSLMNFPNNNNNPTLNGGQISPLISPKDGGGPSTPIKPRAKFDISSATRMIAVSGKEGFGKSSLVTAIAKKFFALSKQNKSYNLNVLKNRTISVVSTNPFQSIKSIIQDLLIRYYKFFVVRENETAIAVTTSSNMSGNTSTLLHGASLRGPALVHASSVRGSVRLASSSNLKEQGSTVATFFNIPIDQQIRNGLNYISPFLPSDVQLFLPLLSSSNIVSDIPENEYTETLVGKSRLLSTLEILSALIDVFPMITGNILFCVFEKLHLFDAWSLSLLNQIWQNSKGIIMLCTYNPVVKDTSNAAVTTAATAITTSNVVGDAIANSTPPRPALLRTNTEKSVTSSRKTVKELQGFDPELFFQQYEEDESRFKILNLQLLDKDSIQSIVSTMTSGGANNGNINSNSLENNGINTNSKDGEEGGSDGGTSSKHQTISGLLLDKVFDMSGGNPLYALAIVNSVNLSEINNNFNNTVTGSAKNVQYQSFLANSGAHGGRATGGKQNSMTNLESILSATTNRIGEVICYRFDQLDTLTQVILKSAAVICSNNSTFSFDTLLFLMEDENNPEITSSTSDTTAILTSLRTLLEHEEFIQIVDVINTDNDVLLYPEIILSDPNNNNNINGSKSVKGATGNEDNNTPPNEASNAALGITDYTIKQSRYAFRVVIEQMTIYDLLISEQKEHVHELVASYYRKINSIYQTNSVYEVKYQLEEAFHWNHAAIWPYAVSCHYKAACQYREYGDYENFKLQLKSITQLYNAMRNDIGLSVQAEFSVNYLIQLYDEYDRDCTLLQQVQQEGEAGVAVNGGGGGTVMNVAGPRDRVVVASSKTSSVDMTAGNGASPSGTIGDNLTSGFSEKDKIMRTGTNDDNNSIIAKEKERKRSLASDKINPKVILDGIEAAMDSPRSITTEDTAPTKAPPPLQPPVIAGEHEDGTNNTRQTQSTTSKRMKRGSKASTNFFYTYPNARLLHEMCLGDGDALTTLLSSQIALAQCNILACESPMATLSILEDCLMILFLYQKYMITHHYYYQHNLRTPTAAASNAVKTPTKHEEIPPELPSEKLSAEDSTLIEITANLLQENQIDGKSDEAGKSDTSPTKLRRGSTVRFRDTEQSIPVMLSPRHNSNNDNKHHHKHIYQKYNKPTAFTIQSFEYYLCQVYSLYIWLNSYTPIANAERLKKAWFICEKYLVVSSDPSLWISMNFIESGTTPLQSFSTVASQQLNHPIMTVYPAASMNENYMFENPRQSAHKSTSQYMGFHRNNTELVLRVGASERNSLPSTTKGGGAQAPSLRSSLGPSESFIIRSSFAHSATPFGNISPRAVLPNMKSTLQQNNLRFLSKVHSIQATCLYVLLLLKEGKIAKAVKKCDRILSNYSIAKYSETLIQIYHYDITQYTLVMVCQQLLLVGEIEKCFYYFTIIFENISQFTHYYTIFMTFIPLYSLGIALRKFGDIYNVMLLLEKAEKETFHLPIFPILVKLQMKYLLIMGMILWNDDHHSNNGTAAGGGGGGSVVPLRSSFLDTNRQSNTNNNSNNNNNKKASAADLQFDQYYHNFLSNSFAKPSSTLNPIIANSSNLPNEMMTMAVNTNHPHHHHRDWTSTKHHHYIQEMNDIHQFYQSELIALRQQKQKQEKRNSYLLAKNNTNGPATPAMTSSTSRDNSLILLPTGAIGSSTTSTKSRQKLLSEMNEEDFLFLYRNSYFGYFLYLQGFSIESLLATIKLLQYFVEHHENNPYENFIESLPIFENDYQALIRMKGKYFSYLPPTAAASSSTAVGGAVVNNCIYSEFIPFSILLSLYNDCIGQQKKSSPSASSSATSVKVVGGGGGGGGRTRASQIMKELQFSPLLLTEIQQLLKKSEKYSYHLSLTIFGEVLLRIHNPNVNALMLPSAEEKKEDGSMDRADGNNTWQIHGEEMKKKGFTFIQENNNLSQMKGFEYLFYRMTNILL